jgi:hypothetical protein
MKDDTKLMLIIILPFIIAVAFVAIHTIWFHSLPVEEQDRINIETINNECNSTLEIYSSVGAFLGKSDRDNGTFNPMSNMSKTCYFPVSDPYKRETKIVTIAGFKDNWLQGDCTIVTKQNELYSTWTNNPCIKLTPGNNVEITFGMVKGYEKFGNRIFDAEIL